MAEDPRLGLKLSGAARLDLLEIWTWNAEQYGADHADTFVATLTAGMERLREVPSLGQLVEDFPGVRAHLVRKDRQSYGYRVFYRILGTEVQVLRILHTARDWPNLL